jgi:hypothetical protein
MRQLEEWIPSAAFSRKGKQPSLPSHLDVVVLPPVIRLLYPFVVSSTAAPPLSL